MLLGDLSTKQGEELSDMAVKYQERIAFATMRAIIPDWQPPSNWNELSNAEKHKSCLLYTSPSPRDRQKSRMPSSA